MEVIENIKRIRTELGISRKELAAAIGKSESIMSRIENGKMNLRVDDLAKIAHFFSLREIDLYTWPDRYVKDAGQEAETEAILQIKLKPRQKERILNDVFGKKLAKLIDQGI
jgi:transcriptional regulator with XRE-family HTH domain